MGNLSGELRTLDKIISDRLIELTKAGYRPILG
jgi:hypothetical protein